jgi:hypothetical protein
MPKEGDTIFNVSVRLGESTMNKLDFIAEVEGIPRVRFVREALTDYLDGLPLEKSAGMRCYEDWCKARSKEKILSRSTFIANWKVKNTPARGERAE